jgi:DNA-binding transcriptional MerR regulator
MLSPRRDQECKVRLADLVRESGCSAATIKYYLREGLLAPGARLSATDAEYDDSHLARLRMIRVLRDVGSLSIANIRDVVNALDQTGLPLHDVLASAVHALGPKLPTDPTHYDESLRAEVVDYVAESGWAVSPDAPSIDAVAAALAGIREFWGNASPHVFDRYRALVDVLAKEDLEFIEPADDLADMIRQMTLGTVLWERALIGLRRLAQEHYSRQRF